MAAYARQPAARTTSVWSVVNNVATLLVNLVFPVVASGTDTATRLTINKTLTGGGEVILQGVLTPPIPIAPGVTPTIAAGTTVTQITADGMPDTGGAAADLLKFLLNNTTWAGYGDATGLVGSAAAGNVFVGMAKATAGEGDVSTTNEISYT